MTEKGKRLGRYRLEELLGQGGMAEVWRATDERLGRTVAVKAILAVHAREGHFRERFRAEARLVASLDHPNILPVFDYGDEEGLPYLVMPYLEGGTLRDRMVGSPVPFAQAVSWIRQLGDALDAAHEAGILHRDVKPANVLIRRDDRLALADFGIAKMLESSTGLTATGMVVGTPIYMAPEQAQGKPATPASDRYALAVLAYELLSGKPPFDGESALSLMHQHVTAPAPPLSSFVHGLPGGLDPVFERALAKDPERRPPTCRAFAHELLAFVPTGAGLEIERATAPWSLAERTSPTVYEATPKRLAERAAARPSSLTSEPTISTAPRVSRRTLLAAGVAAAGVVVLAGGWLLAPRSRPAAEGPASAVPGPSPAAAPAEPVPGTVKVVELPVPTVPPVPAGPPPEAGTPVRPPEIRAASEDAPGPFPPGAAETAGPGINSGTGSDAERRAAQSRLDPFLNGGKRPARADFVEAARTAQAALEEDPLNPGARALEQYALGGIAYVDRKDGDAWRHLLAAQAVAGRPAASDLKIPRAIVGPPRGGTGASWELALAYGDARREAGPLIAADLENSPGDPRALLGRAWLRRMERRSADAVADATAVFESQPPRILAASAAELIADEHAAQRRWEEAVRWYREAALPQGPESARAGWEGGRILEERLGRADEARELYSAACHAGNRRACVESGEPAPRPHLFPRRRGP